MKKAPITICFLLLLTATFLAACGGAATILEMEMTGNYDSSDPFVNEKLIYVSDTVGSVELHASFQLEGESGVLEIVDRETGETLWSDAWNGTVEKSSFIISLDSLEPEKEYIVRFTGTGIEYAKLVITSENSLVQEKERPSKTERN